MLGYDNKYCKRCDSECECAHECACEYDFECACEYDYGCAYVYECQYDTQQPPVFTDEIATCMSLSAKYTPQLHDDIQVHRDIQDVAQAM